MLKYIWVLYFWMLSIFWFSMCTNFFSMIKYNLFCISDYVYSTLHQWLGRFYFASVICTFCGIIWWITGTIEYHLGMSTFAVYTLIPELSLFWTVWGWFPITHCIVFFSYCVYFMCLFRWYRLSILRVWTIFYIRCTLRRIEGRCCRNLHMKYLYNNW